uniref:RRM domain-containing protein n=1 Tax=Oryza punctata TaxID=4537 RepID=A0A0E0KPH9_ORYPU
MVEPTVRDVLAFHRVDRAAYEQLLSLGVPPPPARNAVALLMLYALLRRHEEGDGGGAVLPAELAAPYRRPIGPAPATVGDGGCRSLFITFSKGLPLTREEIEEYFTERWGDCLDKVMMEKTPAGEPPTYGRIVFRHAAMATAVLGGEHLVKLVVNGRQLWARKYFPSKASAMA